MQNYFSNGKLLLTGEYAILDGALSLAVPTKFGQSFKVESIEESKLIWNSLDDKGGIWFEDEFELSVNEISHAVQNNINVSERLIQIFNTIKQLNSNFFNTKNGFKITTKLDFPTNWGLGTSSTLINNIAQWAQVDPYTLLEKTFGGSGYDIACAAHDSPITYQLINNSSEISHDTKNDKERFIKEVEFNPSFKNQLYFVHLNKKQNSRDGIKHYYEQKKNSSIAIEEISEITSKIITCNSLSEFEVLINQHEQIISKFTNQTPVKQLLFSDFNGSIKSLGAWGGDFVLATSKENPEAYFKNKGYHTIIPYKDMVL